MLVHVKQTFIKSLSNNVMGHDTKKKSILCGTKITENLVFQPEAPVLKYHQKTSNSCCLSILASLFHSIGDNRAVTDFVNRIGESLTLQTDKFRNRIHFSDYIMTNRKHIKGEKHLKYNLNM